MPLIQVNNVTLSFTDEGVGEPVLCLHGSCSSSALWRSLSRHLRDRYRVLAPDLYGYGKTSPWSRPSGMRVEDEAALVSALLEHCGPLVHLVGHSYGGAVALKLGLAKHDRIHSLILIEPGAWNLLRLEREDEAFAEIRALKEAGVEAVQCGDDAKAAQLFVDRWNGPGAWQALPEHQRVYVVGTMRKLGLEWEAVFADPTRLADYAGITLPTLMLSGDSGPIPGRRLARLLADVIPSCTYSVIEGAGHMSPFTHAPAVNAAIKAHLGQNPIA